MFDDHHVRQKAWFRLQNNHKTKKTSRLSGSLMFTVLFFPPVSISVIINIWKYTKQNLDLFMKSAYGMTRQRKLCIPLWESNKGKVTAASHNKFNTLQKAQCKHRVVRYKHRFYKLVSTHTQIIYNEF